MQMRSFLSLLPLALLAAGACGLARAESTYGYNTAGTGNVSATAKLTISVVVPKVVVLRVGSAGNTVDTLTYNARVSIPNTPTNIDGDTPGTSSNSTPVVWDGTAPSTSVPGVATRSAAAFVWTNGSGVSVKCVATSFDPGGPTLANVVAAAGSGDTFTHPAANLAGCDGTPSPNLTANTLYTGTWTYTLDSSNANTWKAGAYSTTVTYTAAGT